MKKSMRHEAVQGWVEKWQQYIGKPVPLQEQALRPGFKEHLTKADTTVGSVVEEAHRAGIPWSEIFKLMLHYGPQFLVIIRQILAQLKPAPLPTPTPTPTPPPQAPPPPVNL